MTQPAKAKIFNLKTLSDADFGQIKTALKNGAAAVLPTDSVYGLVTYARAPGALDKINRIKNNPPGKPPQLLCTLQQALELAAPAAGFKKITVLWPGALTAVARASAAGAALTGRATVGLRVPDNKFILSLAQSLESPLFASSANLHGSPVCRSGGEVLAAFAGAADIIVLDGFIETAPSAVIDITLSPPKIMRPGPLGEAALKLLQGLIIC
jgi:L-threonylcarbamoyladenylate synthase